MSPASAVYQESKHAVRTTKPPVYKPPQPNPKPNYAKQPNYPSPSFSIPSKNNYQDTLFRGQKPQKAVAASKSETAPKSTSYSASAFPTSYKKQTATADKPS